MRLVIVKLSPLPILIQLLASGSGFQIPLACIYPLMLLEIFTLAIAGHYAALAGRKQALVTIEFFLPSLASSPVRGYGSSKISMPSGNIQITTCFR